MRERSILLTWALIAVGSFSQATPLTIDKSLTRPPDALDKISGSNEIPNGTKMMQNGLRTRPDMQADGPFLTNILIRGAARPTNRVVGGAKVVMADDSSMVLANATTVLCQDGFLRVLVDKTQLQAVLGAVFEDQLSFRDTVDMSCRATPKVGSATQFGLATLFAHCMTSVSTYKSDDGRSLQLVQNQVIFESRHESAIRNSTDKVHLPDKMTVNISCSMAGDNSPGNLPIQAPVPQTKIPRLPSLAIPFLPPLQLFNQDHNKSNHSFRLTLSNKTWTGPDAEMSWAKYPFSVVVGSRLYAQIQMTEPSSDDDLKAFAKECFFSKNSDPFLEPKVVILTSGCPVPRSATLHYSKTLPIVRYTRFSFVLEKFYFESNFMYFQCKVVACSLRGGREQEGYEMCTNSTVCTDRTIDSKYVPMDSPYSYVSSGLLMPVMRVDDGPKDTSSENANVTCPPCPTLPAMSEPQRDVSRRIEGVPLVAVIPIGVGSFLVGIMLMGALWFIHEHTEPKKYLQVHGKRRNSDRDSSSCVSTATPNACTPMTKIIPGSDLDGRIFSAVDRLTT